MSALRFDDEPATFHINLIGHLEHAFLNKQGIRKACAAALLRRGERGASFEDLIKVEVAQSKARKARKEREGELE